jgi:shikimate dehydrogenase
MVYGADPTAFLVQAQQCGAARIADGAGMLGGQAAASVALWHGVTPNIEPVLNELRRQLLHP